MTTLPPVWRPEEPSGSEMNLIELLLPPQAAPLLLLLLFIFPLALLTGESLFIPLWEWLRSLTISNTDATTANLPIYFFAKLAGFLVLTFFGLIQMVLRIKTIYFTAWTRPLSRPHPLHVDYRPDALPSMRALLNWNLYRILMVVGPPVLLAICTGLVGLAEIYLFNLLSGMPFISLPIQFVISLFLIMLLSLFTVLACLYSVWTLITTVLGDVVAITEPELPAKSIFERCGRIAFSSRWVYGLYPLYLFLFAVVGVELYYVLNQFDIQNLIHDPLSSFPIILLLEVLTLGVYLLVNYLKLLTYHNALTVYYQELPTHFKEKFAPPPSAPVDEIDPLPELY